jgi:hypothetical protein
MSEPDRSQALSVAKQIGCFGVHQNTNGAWMPCASAEEFSAASKGKNDLLAYYGNLTKMIDTAVSKRSYLSDSNSAQMYESRQEALDAGKDDGLTGLRVVRRNGRLFFVPRKPKQRWQNLDEKPIAGIETLPGGGLVSASVSGKSVEKKGFVNRVSRSTDPDTFSDPDSARIRARNIGCIGIRRYTARDGKLVWLPCSNVSDYNRVTGIRGDNSPRNNPRRQGTGFKEKTLGDPIGGSVASSGNKPIDGDGDGYVASTPGGVDDTRVSPKQEKRPKGEVTKGNIDLNNRPVVKNRDGSISTVRSITITEGNTAVVIPTVIKRPNGSGVIVSDREAIKYYQRSGQHLGKFSNIRDADIYAQNLHNQQAAQYPNPGKSFISATGHFGSLSGAIRTKSKAGKTKEIDMSSQVINTLAMKVRQHNAEMNRTKSKDWSQTNLRSLKSVYRRGLASFTPNKGAASPQQWALARVNSFLKILRTGKPENTKYRTDNDLLPDNHPWRKNGDSKSFAVNGTEYNSETSQVGYRLKYGAPVRTTRFYAQGIKSEE